MYIFHLFRSFLPGLNPIGFSATDFIEIVLTIVLVGLALASRRWIEPYGQRLAEKTGWCMLLLLLLPIALRLALLAQYPIPAPNVSDDFSYLLSADTLRHFRLANPVHPLHQFFETYFVLQQPSYASIFPLGQGFILALGWAIFGQPWAGVALSIGALCALCYWMLRAWTTPGWALIGGLLAVIEFGPLSQWMNSYWGGAVAGCAGCLAFGALPRLSSERRKRYGALLGLGIGIHWLCRPYETIFLVLSVVMYLLPGRRLLAKPTAVAMLVMFPALAISLLQNQQTTGNWTTLPYQLSRYQYGVPTTFTVQPVPTPHQTLTHEQQLDYAAQSEVHGPGTDTFAGYWRRWFSRIRFYHFFLLVPLYLALPPFLLRLRDYRFVWIVLTIFAFSLGTNFYPYFYTHYIAALTCLFVLIAVAGLERLSSWRPDAAQILLFLCAAHFLFWYGLHASRDEQLYAAMTPFETWDTINHGDPQGRIAIAGRLAAAPGRHLVFVRYWPQHQFQEWVHNAADIDSARVVWARDLGPDENKKLLLYYPNRTAWLLEPDAHPPVLRPYPR
ncbi:MAG TPA: hypothetical protein VK708_20390 [Bryobacteraceae bacterium]|nr:hypothetical protein [Bryobacteraceae bacterium]